MGLLHRRRRKKNTLVARSVIEGQAGDGPAERLTAALVLCGDYPLELLIVTATESFSRVPKEARKRDEDALTDATSDPARLEATWVWLAHVMLQWIEGRAQEDENVALALRAGEALAALREHKPLSIEQAKLADMAPRAEQLAYGTEESVIASGAFQCLLGEQAADLGAWNDRDPYTDEKLLEISVRHGSQSYLEVLN